MNDDFKVDENGLTRDGYRVLEPVSKRAMYMRNAIEFVICAILTGLYYHYIGGQSGYEPLNWMVLALFVIVSAYLIAGPRVFYDHYRYRIDDDKVEVRRGIIFIRHTLVPVERIHQVQVGSGPIRRSFGLADVSVTTAGGTAYIEYLEKDVAESIASNLNDYVVRMLKDRE